MERVLRGHGYNLILNAMATSDLQYEILTLPTNASFTIFAPTDMIQTASSLLRSPPHHRRRPAPATAFFSPPLLPPRAPPPARAPSTEHPDLLLHHHRDGAFASPSPSPQNVQNRGRAPAVPPRVKPRSLLRWAMYASEPTKCRRRAWAASPESKGPGLLSLQLSSD